MEYSEQRYLAAKRTVDDRALNRGVLLSELSMGGRILRSFATLAKTLTKDLEAAVNS